jgi:hypothetical protein
LIEAFLNLDKEISGANKKKSNVKKVSTAEFNKYLNKKNNGSDR